MIRCHLQWGAEQPLSGFQSNLFRFFFLWPDLPLVFGLAHVRGKLFLTTPCFTSHALKGNTCDSTRFWIPPPPPYFFVLACRSFFPPDSLFPPFLQLCLFLQLPHNDVPVLPSLCSTFYLSGLSLFLLVFPPSRSKSFWGFPVSQFYSSSFSPGYRFFLRSLSPFFFLFLMQR